MAGTAGSMTFLVATAEASRRLAHLEELRKARPHELRSAGIHVAAVVLVPLLAWLGNRAPTGRALIAWHGYDGRAWPTREARHGNSVPRRDFLR